MAFWSKKKEEKKEDIEAVKQAVSQLEVPQEQMDMPKIELGKLPDRPRFAPLFVKIDRYQEVLKTIEDLKSMLLNARDILSVMQQLDKVKMESESLLQKNIQEVVKSIAALDNEFVRPKGLGMEETITPSFRTEKVESYVGELERELQHLRSQLQGMS